MKFMSMKHRLVLMVPLPEVFLAGFSCGLQADTGLQRVRECKCKSVLTEFYGDLLTNRMGVSESINIR